MGRENRARRKRKLARKAAQRVRRRERSRVQKQDRTLAPNFQVVPNPFEGLSEEKRRLAIEEIAKNSERKYQEALAELKTILQRYHPVLVLSHMSCYSLSVPVDENAGLTKLDSDYEIFPYHVEILQALSLQIEPDELSGEVFGPHVLTQVWNQVKVLCEAHNYRKLDPAGRDLPDDERAVALAQEMLRGATQIIRNWGYHLQIKRIARELYSSFDAKLQEIRGFCASDVLEVFEAIVIEVESRQTFRFQTLRDLFNSSRTDRHLLIENYCELIGLDRKQAGHFMEHVNLEETPLDQGKITKIPVKSVHYVI